ncbi:MAG: hypothetical protein CL686_02955, partial [Candidatus Nitrosopelagicus sp.]|nr:hypothetical protein [Candidatus Nitrosopelagicus sp.]
FRINWNSRFVFVSYLDGLCMVVHHCSIFFKGKKLFIEKEFQDNYCRIEPNFDIFWHRFFVKIIN